MYPELSTEQDLRAELRLIERTIRTTQVFDARGHEVNPDLIRLATREEHICIELARRHARN